MKFLITVNGVVTREDVRLICPHEHLFLDMTHEAVEPETEEEKKLFYSDITMDKIGLLRRNPYIMYTNLKLEDMGDCISELGCLKKMGCDLLIDVTSVGLGRDVEKLKTVSSKMDIHIAAGCGYFVHETAENLKQMTVEQIAAQMISEIEEGIRGSGIKPGVIGEIGTSEVLYETERKSLKAAAAANLKTGLPIYIHTYPWSRAGLEAIDILLNEGVLPSQICICHLDVSFDKEYMEQAFRLGVYVEFDNFGKEFFFQSQSGAFSGGPFETDVDRVRMLRKLIEKGYAGQILLANDLCLKASLHKYGGWGYDHVFSNVPDMMRYEGISEKDIHTLIVENPKEFLFQ